MATDRYSEHQAVAFAYRDAASRARNCTHSCVSGRHCDFLHAAHERLARDLEAMASHHEAAAKKVALTTTKSGE